MKSSLSEVQTFIYRDYDDPGMDAPPETEKSPRPMAVTTISEEEARQREQAVRMSAWAEARDQAWREAYAEAEAKLRVELEQRLETERRTVAAALNAFLQQRSQYFNQLEREVVHLVLALVRKVLQREANIDPLLLAGTVHVALGPLAAGAAVTLVVPPSLLPQWEALFSRNGQTPPQMRTDAALEPGGCRLETETGSTDLGLDAQLREIEQGFLDLLQRRTAAIGHD